jgi:hypothetical protein
MSNLGLQQQHILRWLLKRTRQAEPDDPQSLAIGFWWALKVNDKANENSRRASFCRSRERLEGRGLIRCVRGRKKAWTVRVLLTEEGRQEDAVVRDLGGNQEPRWIMRLPSCLKG